jgi:hypothetical protein
MGWLPNEIVTQARLPRGAPMPSRSPTHLPAAIDHTLQTINTIHLMMQDIFTPGLTDKRASPSLSVEPDTPSNQATNPMIDLEARPLGLQFANDMPRLNDELATEVDLEAFVDRRIEARFSRLVETRPEVPVKSPNESHTALLAGVLDREIHVPQLDSWLQDFDEPWNGLRDSPEQATRHIEELTFPAPSVGSPESPGLHLGSSSRANDLNSLRCEYCDASFTGRYRLGNYNRHIRARHTLGSDARYPCHASGCGRSFTRKDARLKHTRNYHPELHIPPPRQRDKPSPTRSPPPPTPSEQPHPTLPPERGSYGLGEP